MEAVFPKILESDTKFIKISGYGNHVAAINNLEKLYTWGDYTSGALGHDE